MLVNIEILVSKQQAGEKKVKYLRSRYEYCISRPQAVSGSSFSAAFLYSIYFLFGAVGQKTSSLRRQLGHFMAIL